MRGLLAIALVTLTVGSGCQVFTTAQSPFSPGHLNQGHYVEPLYGFERDVYPTGGSIRYGVNNYFTFDLSAACEATGVILQLTQGRGTGGELRIHDVTTPAETVNDPGGTPWDPDVFEANARIVAEDLRTGVSFGTFQVPRSTEESQDDVLSFVLNSAGVAAFNEARGGFFSVGGDGNGWDDELSGPLSMFGGVSDPAKLVVGCAPPPE